MRDSKQKKKPKNKSSKQIELFEEGREKTLDILLNDKEFTLRSNSYSILRVKYKGKKNRTIKTHSLLFAKGTIKNGWESVKQRPKHSS